MIRIGQSSIAPPPTPGNVLVYATDDGLEVKDENGQVVNLRDLANLADSLQLYVFGTGFAREKFSDLPTNVPTGAYALDADSGAIYRAGFWPTLSRIVWIPSDAYKTGTEYEIVAALTGAEANESQVNQSRLTFRVIAGPEFGVDPEIVYTGTGIQVNFGVNQPIPAPDPGVIDLGTDPFGPLPDLYDETTTVWVVCEVETLAATPSQDVSVRPVEFSNGVNAHNLAEISGPLDLFTHNDAPVSNNAWYTGSEQVQTEGGKLIVFKYSLDAGDGGGTGFVETFVDGKPYRSAQLTAFSASPSPWNVGIRAIVSVGASASLVIRKYTVVVGV